MFIKFTYVHIHYRRDTKLENYNCGSIYTIGIKSGICLCKLTIGRVQNEGRDRYGVVMERDTHQWGIGTAPSLEHGDTFHLSADREYLTLVPMLGEDVRWKSL